MGDQHDETSSQCRDEGGWSRLHHAASKGDHELCSDLLDQGSDPNIRTGILLKDSPLRKDWYWAPGDTPLLLAAEKGHLKTVKVLLDAGATADLVNTLGWSPLHAAVIADNVELLMLLLKAGASPNPHCRLRAFDDEMGWYFVLTVNVGLNFPKIAGRKFPT